MTKSSRLVAGALAAGVAAISVVAAVGVENRPGPSPSDLGLIGGVMSARPARLCPSDRIFLDQLTKDALKGILTRLDPHSDYMDEAEFKESQGTISGKFGGLGIELSQQDGVPKVIAPIDGTPASRAGIQPGDLIVAIEGKSTHGMGLDDTVGVLRGKPGTTVKLTIARGTNAPFDVSLTRSIIHIQTVKSKLEPNGIGYVRVTEFGDDTAKSVKQALGALKQEAGGKLKGFVLDFTERSGRAPDRGGRHFRRFSGRRHGREHPRPAPWRGSKLWGARQG